MNGSVKLKAKAIQVLSYEVLVPVLLITYRRMNKNINQRNARKRDYKRENSGAHK